MEEFPVEIPVDTLSANALAGIIDNFIQREGTDYGVQETLHETKVRQIRAQIDRGDILIVFDAASETVTLLTKNQWGRLHGA